MGGKRESLGLNAPRLRTAGYRLDRSGEWRSILSGSSVGCARLPLRSDRTVEGVATGAPPASSGPSSVAVAISGKVGVFPPARLFLIESGLKSIVIYAALLLTEHHFV